MSDRVSMASDSSGSIFGAHARVFTATLLLSVVFAPSLGSNGAVTFLPLSAAAQAEVSAQDRAAAADAFDRGTRSYIARDYARAAEWFETAYRMAPAPAALIQAVRAHSRAGNRVRAATLALRLTVNHSDVETAVSQAEDTLSIAPELVRVDVGCERECTIELDGVLIELPSFFVEPGTDHTVRVSYDTGPVEQQVSGAAGEVIAVNLAPPVGPVVARPGSEQPGGGSATGSGTGTTQPNEGGGGGLSPAFAIVGLGLTAVSAGLTIGFGVDALNGVDAYNQAAAACSASPSITSQECIDAQNQLDRGRSRELATNVMIGVTAGVAAITVILLILTDWDGDSPSSTTPQAWVAPMVGDQGSGVMTGIDGRF